MINLLILANNFESISMPKKVACNIKNMQENTPKQKNFFENLTEVFLFFNSLKKFKLFFQYKNNNKPLKMIKDLKINIAGKNLAVLLIDTSP